MKKITPIIISILIFLVASGSSCNMIMDLPDLEVKYTKLELESIGGSVQRTIIRTAYDWKITVESEDGGHMDWLKISHMSGEPGEIPIAFTALSTNNTNAIKKAYITISNKKKSVTLEVSQLIDCITFTDLRLKANLLTRYDANNDGEISDYEMRTISALDCSKGKAKSLRDLYGYPFLTINCSENLIDTLDISQFPKLISIDCQRNLMKCLIAGSSSSIVTINCEHNTIRLLDVSNCKSLKTLKFTYNVLDTINISNTNLTSFDCSMVGLGTVKHINASNCASLEELNCRFNSISELNLAGCASLKKLFCNFNDLTTLDISTSPLLENIDCSNNNLNEIAVDKAIFVKELDISSNKIRFLDLRKNMRLTHLWAMNNPLERIDLSVEPSETFIYSEDTSEKIESYREEVVGGHILYYYYKPEVYINGELANTIHRVFVVN
ncbi:MAG: hypothetical protein GX993_06340 [Bacteroidales bacterium]|nr:hypothetical protein [Bacteroidales bacterium]